MSSNIYATYVEAMKNVGDKHFFNDSTDDAKIVLTKFINSATSSVRIFARSLNHEIYNDFELVCSIKRALDRKIFFDIMIQSDVPDKKSTFLIALLSAKKYSNFISLKTGVGQGLKHNVCTVDSDKFRFEYDPDNRKAEAAWGDKQMTSQFNNFLNAVKVSC